jgi:hypothetical protein
MRSHRCGKRGTILCMNNIESNTSQCDDSENKDYTYYSYLNIRLAIMNHSVILFCYFLVRFSPHIFFFYTQFKPIDYRLQL